VCQQEKSNSTMSNEALPIVSIITIVFNGETFIERTILSIINQTYPKIEYIIIDGNSKDGTLNIVRKYEQKISTCISEPDKGLYDAMNKGIKASGGDYLMFINAGDELFDNTVIERMMTSSNDFPDILYGETLMVNEVFMPLGTRSEITPHKLPTKLNWKDLNRGMVVCHQSIMIKKNIADLYNLSHPFCADIDWIIKALKKAKTIVNVGFIVSKYLKGGISDKKMKASLVDRFKVLTEHYGLFPTIFNHIFILFRAIRFYK